MKPVLINAHKTNSTRVLSRRPHEEGRGEVEQKKEPLLGVKAFRGRRYQLEGIGDMRGGVGGGKEKRTAGRC